MLYIYSGHAFDLNNGLWVWVFSSNKGPEYWDPSLSKRFVWKTARNFKLLQHSPGSLQIMCENRKGLSGSCKGSLAISHLQDGEAKKWPHILPFVIAIVVSGVPLVADKQQLGHLTEGMLNLKQTDPINMMLKREKQPIEPTNI
ncbi:hypothetical protein Acr_04g0010260 [Actinidia rufa]|uniref:Uncharacterized protein n=1 Tax=Actinidia rufa TaxID=165716 RepID=A0A7J0EIJ2_9ERIC|nr:hypothetical protein Acr_04g0010260 [Actinidia rufa]